MSDWAGFCDTLDLGALVPPQLEHYRPAVVDGLTYFLENLSPDRTLAILADQAALPADAGVERRLVAIARHCPALHKLGQVLARDRRLPPEFRVLLQSLESMTPKAGLAGIRAELRRQLGPLEALGVRLDGPPLAEASVSVVVPFRGPDGERGVFKVLKPGIEDKLGEELRLLQGVGALLDERCRRYGLPEIAYEDSFAQVRTLLANEVRLDTEQAHLRAARTAYAGMRSVLVPEVYPFSTPRVTAMERVDGRKVTDMDRGGPRERRALAALIAEALLARPMWSLGEVTRFHADPHAGNLFATDDGRLAILDWSLVGTLGKADQVRLSQVLVGAASLDRERVARAVTELAGGAVNADALRGVVDDSLARLRGHLWPSLEWLQGLMDGAVMRARARFAGDLMAYRKVLQTLKGVIADVSEDCCPDTVLASSFLKRLAVEWGFRALVPPFSRHFTTHLSNMDLARLYVSLPLVAARHLGPVRA